MRFFYKSPKCIAPIAPPRLEHKEHNQFTSIYSLSIVSIPVPSIHLIVYQLIWCFVKQFSVFRCVFYSLHRFRTLRTPSFNLFLSELKKTQRIWEKFWDPDMASGILAKRTRNVGYHSVSPGDKIFLFTLCTEVPSSFCVSWF